MSTLDCRQCRRDGLFFKEIRKRLEAFGVDMMDVKYGGEIMELVENQLKQIEDTEHTLRTEIEFLRNQTQQLEPTGPIAFPRIRKGK